MSPVKSLIASLVQNPAALRSIVEDPQALGRLAGLGEVELRALAGAGNAVMNLCKGLGCRNGTAPNPVSTTMPAPRGNGSGVAIASVVSLLAVTGALAATGTVALVALNSRQD